MLLCASALLFVRMPREEDMVAMQYDGGGGGDAGQRLIVSRAFACCRLAGGWGRTYHSLPPMRCGEDSPSPARHTHKHTCPSRRRLPASAAESPT
ncbi:unnamed protein product [Schistocephalus solidus]|uniref:Secreted protein n=1 Tax=Schistocephalus solidus TaxID=70667 RepID=A0A183T4D7_SCHSO|nr:unnamed protein product [Schistocephalus solidus]